MRTGSQPPVLLASQSYQRQRLLSLLGIDHEVVTNSFDEHSVLQSDFSTIEEYVSTIGIGKVLQAVSDAPIEGKIVLGGDLLVFVDGRAIGKPRDFTQAREYIDLLLGREHVEVCSVALWSEKTGPFARTETMRVTLPKLPEEWVQTYLNTANPLEKAGALSLATVAGVARDLGFPAPQVMGSVSGVLGFSAQLVSEMLAEAGAPTPIDWQKLETDLRRDILVGGEL